jgi:hypothetical protein
MKSSKKRAKMGEVQASFSAKAPALRRPLGAPIAHNQPSGRPGNWLSRGKPEAVALKRSCSNNKMADEHDSTPLKHALDVGSQIERFVEQNA